MPLDPKIVEHLAAGLGDAIDWHRDFKSGNVMLVPAPGGHHHREQQGQREQARAAGSPAARR